MTFVFQFMLMLVSLYGLKISEAPAVPVDPPPPLDPPLDPPPAPASEPPLEPPLLPPGHVVPPGSHPVPQLTVWQWYPWFSLSDVQPHDSPALPSHAFALLPM
jgi:hypothetical protein